MNHKPNERKWHIVIFTKNADKFTVIGNNDMFLMMVTYGHFFISTLVSESCVELQNHLLSIFI